MAPPTGSRIIAAAIPGRLLLWLLSALAAPHIAAVSLDVLSSVGLDPDSAGTAVLESEPAEVDHVMEAEEASRADALSLATDYVGALKVNEPRGLSQVRDTLFRLEDLDSSLRGAFSDKDLNPPEGLGPLLRDIEDKAHSLRRLAIEKEANGEVDDGGNVLPSSRDNICSTIDLLGVDDELREEVKVVCEGLDNIRSLLLAGADAEAKIFETTGRVGALDVHEDYHLPFISDGIAAVLSQEARWIMGKLEQSMSPEDREIIIGALDTWGSDDANDADQEADALQAMHDQVQDISSDLHLDLTSVRTNLYRLEGISADLEEYIIVCKDPQMCTRAEELSRLIQEKLGALVARAEVREEAGEVDEVADLLPSQRNNICRNINSYGLDAQLRKEVMHTCESLDRWRKAALAHEDEDKALAELSGRLAVLTSKRGSIDTKVVGELEALWSEEWRWRMEGSESGSDSGSHESSESSPEEEMDD